MSDEVDRRRVQRAATRVGALVGIGSAIILTIGVALLIGVLLATSRREGSPQEGPPHGGDTDRVVVDLDHALPWVVGLGLVGVVLLSLLAWVAARRSVRPLADALRLQRAFVADASHELRTPLTALSSRVQLLQRRLDRAEDPTPILAALRRDVTVMDDTLTDMLLAAEGAGTIQQADAAGAVSAAVQTIAPLADEAGVALRVIASEHVLVGMSPVTLARLCVALLDNAIRHAPEGSTVRISAATEGAAVSIRVADGGTGIAPQDQDRVFERFARGSDSGRRRGFGLGLALVREAANAAGGSVRIERTSPSGTTFLVTLPRV